MRRFKGKVTPSLAISMTALFFAMSCTAVAAVVVSSNSQIAANTVAGHAPIAGIHSNVITGSIDGTDLSAAERGTLKVHCATGLLPSGDICVEPNPRSAVWATALKTCALAGRHLPNEGELALAYNALGATQSYEWTTDTFDASGTLVGAVLKQDANRLLGLSEGDLLNSLNYRCVASPLN